MPYVKAIHTPERIVEEVFAAEEREVGPNDPDELYLISDHEVARLMRRAIEADRAQRQPYWGRA